MTRPATLVAVLAVALSALLPLALAHAELVAMEPARDTVVATPPESVTLTFSEPVEVRFAAFEVHPLTTDVGAEPDFLRLNGLAAERAPEVLADRDDADARADGGAATDEARTAEIVLTLQPDLPGGAYLVTWRVLSVDGHPVHGHAVFVIADGTP